MAKKRRKINLKENIVSRFIDYLCQKYLDITRAATLTEWSRWKKEKKAKHPVLYFILINVPDWVRYKVYWIYNIVYQLKSKYIKKQHYIRIDVERFVTPGLDAYHWYDSDYKILYGTFQILVEYIEDEEAGERIDWNSDPEHKKAWKEIQELYNWWTIDRPARDRDYPKETDYGLEENEIMDGEDSPARRRYLKALDEHSAKEDEFDIEDTEMLIRLVTMRRWLWT